MAETANSALVAIDASPCTGQRTGVGRYVEDLVAACIESGERLALVHQGHHGARPDLPGRSSTRSHRYDLLGGRIGAYLRLPLLLRQLGAEVYHSTSTIAAPGPGWSGRMLATIHDCYPLQPGAVVSARHRRLFAWLLRTILTRAERVIVPSRHTADELLALGCGRPIHVIPHGIAPVARPPRPQTTPAGGYLLTLGAIEHRKGLHLLAAARPGLPWIHCGPAREDPGGRIAAAMDAAGCRRLGFVAEPERVAWMAHATLLAMPSQTEGFGYPALEAMSLGTPVLAFRSGSLPELLDDVACWSSPDRLADDLALLLGDSAARAGMARRGIDRAARYSIGAMRDAHRELYRRPPP